MGWWQKKSFYGRFAPGVTVSCRMQAPITCSRWRCSGTAFCCPGLGSPSRSQRETIALEITKGDEDAFRLIKPTGSVQFGRANAPPSRDRGRPARRAPRFEPTGKGGLYTPRWERAIILPPWSSAGRPAQRREVQRQSRRSLTFSRPRVGIRGRGRDSSTLALRQGVRLHLTSCGRGKISMTQSKRHRCRDLTPLRVGTYVLTAVRRGSRAITRTRRVRGPYAQNVNGWGTPSESAPETSFRNRGMSSGVGGGRFGPTRAAGFRLLCSLVGVS